LYDYRRRRNGAIEFERIVTNENLQRIG